MIDNRILEKYEDKILWIFTWNKYPTSNLRPENQLRARLYDIIVNMYKPKGSYASKSCSVLRIGEGSIRKGERQDIQKGNETNKFFNSENREFD